MNGSAELDRYLFDLQGFLVIENVLSPAEVDVLNALVDAHVEVLPEDWGAVAAENRLGLYNVYRFGMAGGSYPDGPGFLDWGQPFRDLMDHPAVMAVLREQLGQSFRLDRIFGMRMSKGMPNARLHSDYGASQPYADSHPGERYRQPDYQALHGFAVAAFNLTASGPETGGLRVIPGSHHSHYRLPERIRNDEYLDVVVCPKAPAGSVTLFSEATTHGTASWTADHERRTLLYKYCHSNLTWSRTRVTAPEGVDLSPRQQKLLEPPGGAGWFFPNVFSEDSS